MNKAKFRKFAKKCPWSDDNLCDAKYYCDLEVMCTEDNCAPLYWLKMFRVLEESQELLED